MLHAINLFTSQMKQKGGPTLFFIGISFLLLGVLPMMFPASIYFMSPLMNYGVHYLLITVSLCMLTLFFMPSKDCPKEDKSSSRTNPMHSPINRKQIPPLTQDQFLNHTTGPYSPVVKCRLMKNPDGSTTGVDTPIWINSNNNEIRNVT